VRGLLRGLDHPDPREVCSPTFALHHRYEGGRLLVDHLDLFRIEDAAAAERQGLLDPLADRGGLVVIEWWERLERQPQPAILIEFRPQGEEQRRIALTADPECAERLRKLSGPNEP